MTRPLIAAVLATLLAGPALAFDVENMTLDERTAFRAEIRAYLLENPEVLMEAIGVLEERQAAEQAAGDEALLAAHAEALFDDGVSWVGGNPEGDVTLVEFMDYRCGFCRRAFPEVEELVASDGDIRLIIKEFPILGEESMLASRFAIATRNELGDAAYKAVHDGLMEMRANVSEESLERLAESLDLDADAIFVGMESPEVAAEINANRALAQQLEINGTPTFVLADQMIRGYVPLEGMRNLVEDVREDRG